MLMNADAWSVYPATLPDSLAHISSAAGSLARETGSRVRWESCHNTVQRSVE